MAPRNTPNSLLSLLSVLENRWGWNGDPELQLMKRLYGGGGGVCVKEEPSDTRRLPSGSTNSVLVA